VTSVDQQYLKPPTDVDITDRFGGIASHRHEHAHRVGQALANPGLKFADVAGVGLVVFPLSLEHKADALDGEGHIDFTVSLPSRRICPDSVAVEHVRDEPV
jgi:hypothetical protein